MKTQDIHWKNLVYGVALPLLLFSVAAWYSGQVEPTKQAMPAIGAVILAFIAVYLVPKHLYNFLAQYRTVGNRLGWIKASAVALLLSIGSLISLQLLGRHTSIAAYGFIGFACALGSFAHLVSALLSPKDMAPTPSQNTPPPSGSSTTASSLRAAEQRKQFQHGGFYEQYLVFSPDSKNLATWEPNKIQVFSLSDDTKKLEISTPQIPIGFTKSNHLIVTGDGTVEEWSVDSSEKSKSFDSPEPGLVGADKSWKVHKMNAATYVICPSSGVMAPLKGHDWRIYNPYNLRYNESKDLVFAALGSSAGLLDSKTGEVLWRTPSVGRDVTCVGISNDGQCGAFGSMGGSVFIVDFRSQEVVGRMMVPGEIRCMEFAPDGRHVAVGCGDHLSDIVILHVSTGPACKAEIKYSNNWAVGFSPDGKLLGVGTDNGELTVWDWQGK